MSFVSSEESASTGKCAGRNNVEVDSHGVKVTKAELEAYSYLKEKKISELFNFLIGHLLVDEPENPVEYLYDLLDKCLLFKSGLCEPPLLFTPRHISSIFQSLDPMGLGYVSIDQYKTGMRTLGISCFDPNPAECICGKVDRATFMKEAERRLVETLADMIGKSASQENRGDSSNQS